MGGSTRPAVKENPDNAIVAVSRALVNVVGIFSTGSIQAGSTDRLMTCFRALFIESSRAAVT